VEATGQLPPQKFSKTCLVILRSPKTVQQQVTMISPENISWLRPWILDFKDMDVFEVLGTQKRTIGLFKFFISF